MELGHQLQRRLGLTRRPSIEMEKVAVVVARMMGTRVHSWLLVLAAQVDSQAAQAVVVVPLGSSCLVPGRSFKVMVHQAPMVV